MEINTNSKIEKFIYSLEKQTIAKVIRTLDLLEKFGFNLFMPHSKKMANNLFELRIRSQQEIRIFYCFNKNECFLLTGFVKKSQKTPRHELEKAVRLRDEICKRLLVDKI